jgi:hypothetical protein
MSLIGTRIRKWAPFSKGAALGKDTPSEEASLPQPSDSPPLVLLVPDASGRASFQFNSFPDAAAAIDYVNVWFDAQQEGGVIAFWALADEPAYDEGEERVAERVVLIRDAEKTGVVYLFSFVDAEGAQDFVRSETESGIDLDSILVYWAAPIRIDAGDAGSVRLTPEFPPAARDHDCDDLIDEFNGEQIDAVVEAPQPIGWARVIGRTVQISQQVDEPVAAAVATIATPVEPAVAEVEQRIAMMSEDLTKSAVVEHVTAIETLTDGRPSTPPVRRQPARQPRRKPASEPKPLADPLPLLESIQPPSWFTEKDGQPPLDGETWRDDGFHDIPALDMHQQLEKVLSVKRWDPQEAPFQGFQSPPGRF